MDALLIHKCNVQSRTTTTNSLGEPVHTWSNAYIDVPCRFSVQKGMMNRLDTGEFVEDRHILFLTGSQAVEEENRIVGTVGFYDTYEVMKVIEKHDSYGLHHKQLDLRKLV